MNADTALVTDMVEEFNDSDLAGMGDMGAQQAQRSTEPFSPMETMRTFSVRFNLLR